MKRWGFSGMPVANAGSLSQRGLGSIGGRQDPGEMISRWMCSSGVKGTLEAELSEDPTLAFLRREIEGLRMEIEGQIHRLAKVVEADSIQWGTLIIKSTASLIWSLAIGKKAPYRFVSTRYKDLLREIDSRLHKLAKLTGKSEYYLSVLAVDVITTRKIFLHIVDAEDVEDRVKGCQDLIDRHLVLAVTCQRACYTIYIFPLIKDAFF